MPTLRKHDALPTTKKQARKKNVRVLRKKLQSDGGESARVNVCRSYPTTFRIVECTPFLKFSFLKVFLAQRVFESGAKDLYPLRGILHLCLGHDDGVVQNLEGNRKLFSSSSSREPIKCSVLSSRILIQQLFSHFRRVHKSTEQGLERRDVFLPT